MENTRSERFERWKKKFRKREFSY